MTLERVPLFQCGLRLTAELWLWLTMYPVLVYELQAQVGIEHRRRHILETRIILQTQLQRQSAHEQDLLPCATGMSAYERDFVTNEKV